MAAPAGGGEQAAAASASATVITQYYFIGSQRIAMRQGSTVYYFTGDHLGSTSLVTVAGGGEVGRQK